MATWRQTALPLMAAGLLLAASQGARAEYWVRGQAVLDGNNIPAACGSAGKSFERQIVVTKKAQCGAHETCTAAKVKAVNDWTAQFTQRQLGQCNTFVKQSTATCTYSPDCS